ncbi:hypothetical protein GGR51DRAFT_215747 [Nemania sp. FL0031]|nr:hypothetical protein GGR51DRAFT_215747 [Nemania sp. FL0031]
MMLTVFIIVYLISILYATGISLHYYFTDAPRILGEWSEPLSGYHKGCARVLALSPMPHILPEHQNTKRSGPLAVDRSLGRIVGTSSSLNIESKSHHQLVPETRVSIRLYLLYLHTQ